MCSKYRPFLKQSIHCAYTFLSYIFSPFLFPHSWVLLFSSTSSPCSSSSSARSSPSSSSYSSYSLVHLRRTRARTKAYSNEFKESVKLYTRRNVRDGDISVLNRKNSKSVYILQNLFSHFSLPSLSLSISSPLFYLVDFYEMAQCTSSESKTH